MAIQKRFIHFKKFSDFNSKKLSANEANTQYTVGVSGEIQDGEPDILYQSYCWIKDTKQQWTHGQLYNTIDDKSITIDKLDTNIKVGYKYKDVEVVSLHENKRSVNFSKPFLYPVTITHQGHTVTLTSNETTGFKTNLVAESAYNKNLIVVAFNPYYDENEEYNLGILSINLTNLGGSDHISLITEDNPAVFTIESPDYIKPIPKEYLELDTANWNANESEDGFIENRTHYYTDYKKLTVTEPGNYTFTYNIPKGQKCYIHLPVETSTLKGKLWEIVNTGMLFDQSVTIGVELNVDSIIINSDKSKTITFTLSILNSFLVDFDYCICSGVKTLDEDFIDFEDFEHRIPFVFTNFKKYVLNTTNQVTYSFPKNSWLKLFDKFVKLDKDKSYNPPGSGIRYDVTITDNTATVNLMFSGSEFYNFEYNPEDILFPDTLVRKSDTKIQNITYDELKSLRDNSQLIPGQQYRITDYVTTTTQEDTQSAGHQFDVIVTADDESTLNEVAKAIESNGDTYFADSDLNAWQIWYCLDNDTERFAWADATNGKGVIYRMIDEYNNDCPYDFKNIQFIRYELNAPETVNTEPWMAQLSTNIQAQFSDNVLSYIWGGVYDGEIKLWESDYCEVYSTLTGNKKAFYTFSTVIDGVVTDHSMLPGYCYNNTMKEYISTQKQYLENNIFLNTAKFTVCCNNSFGNDCYENSFGDGCNDNSFGNFCGSNSFGNMYRCNSFESGCYKNSFGNLCYLNSFEYECHNNSFGNSCNDNSFGKICYGNSFGNNCDANSFSDSCYYNLFVYYCQSNSFGTDCRNNSFGNECYYNSFINSCYDNSFRNYCSNNSFGNSCSLNSFGNNFKNNSFENFCLDNSFGYNCYSNSFGNECQNNSFGNYCYNNSFGNDCYENSFGDDCKYNSFGNECYGNSFGSNCLSNSFGNNCNDNSFGGYCYYNSFGIRCSYNSFRVGTSDVTQLKRYVKYNHFDDGCSRNIIGNSDTTSSSVWLLNINVNRNVSGIVGSYNRININALNSEQEINVNQVDGIISIGNILSIKYESLKTLRDNAQLIPGQQYRIIDYVTTTSQENTRSARHQFDIIVTALNAYTLSEEAQAIQNTIDGYFDVSNLSAWKLWYCLDNDTNRFMWAGDEKISEIEHKYYDSSECTINSELIDGNTFITPFNFESCVWVDGNGVEEGYNGINHDIDELIYEWGYFTDENDHIHLCLYKSDAGLYEEEGQPDYGDKYLYRGVVNVDGTDYDYWQKWDENGGSVADVGGTGDYVYATTPRIVSNPEAFSVITETEDVYVYGKGVIYRMIDEWNNDCPYDFKNIQFKRKLTNGVLDTENGVDAWCYTFNAYCDDDTTIYDASVIARKEGLDDDANRCYGNIIKENHENAYNEGLELNDIVFLNTYTIESLRYFHCYSNSFGINCHSNSFGDYCYSNSFGDHCYNNSFGNLCYGNSFGNDCYNNSFGNSCGLNCLGSASKNNSFGIDCCYNVFAYNCHNNSFGDHCFYNSFENYCSYNSFGNDCYENSFGNYCYDNSFGNGCYINSFGNGCRANSFRVSADKTATLKDYVRYNHFDDGCSYNVIGNSDTTSSSVWLLNININRGVCGKFIVYNMINIDVLNQDYELQVAKNSSGEIKIYCEADLIA